MRVCECVLRHCSVSPLSRLIAEVGQVHTIYTLQKQVLNYRFCTQLIHIHTYIKHPSEEEEASQIGILYFTRVYTHRARHTRTTSFYWGNLSQPALGRLNQTRNKLLYIFTIICYYLYHYRYTMPIYLLYTHAVQL